MDYKELLQQIMYIVITAILPLLTGYTIKFIKAKVEENSEKLNDERIESYVVSAVDIITDAIKNVNQVYVDSLKKSGKFDAEAQETAKNMAIQKAKELISEDSKKAIEILYNDFDSFLDTKVESIVRDEKQYI